MPNNYYDVEFARYHNWSTDIWSTTMRLQKIGLGLHIFRTSAMTTGVMKRILGTSILSIGA